MSKEKNIILKIEDNDFVIVNNMDDSFLEDHLSLTFLTKEKLHKELEKICNVFFNISFDSQDEAN